MGDGSNNGGGVASQDGTSALEAAAGLLATGRPLEALSFVALRDDPRALALRGVALAQLGQLEESRRLLRRAHTSFGADDPLARARCAAAEGEVAVALRDLSAPIDALRGASASLREHGDHHNAAYAELVIARRSLLLGDLDDVEQALKGLSFLRVPSALAAVAHLLAAELAIRRIRARSAARALDIADEAAEESGIAALRQEVASSRAQLEGVAARLVDTSGERSLRLREVEELLASDTLVVDACRRRLCHADRQVSLLDRPVLLDLLCELAMAGAAGVDRDTLIRSVFGAKRPNDSHRVRLRVDVGRLRKLIAEHAALRATAEGYALRPGPDVPVGVLLPPIPGPHATIAALLADGRPWSTAALALATGDSKRTCQRALASLRDDGRVTTVGKGAALRWVSIPLTGAATAMLLPSARVVG